MMRSLPRLVIALGLTGAIALAGCGQSPSSTNVVSSQGVAPAPGDAIPSGAVAGQPDGVVAGGRSAERPTSDAPHAPPSDANLREAPLGRVATQATRSNPDIGARMDPPAAGTLPRVSAAVAYEKFLSLGIRPGRSATARPDDFVLVVYSNDVYGDIQPSGAVKPRYQNVLSWAVIYRDVPAPARAGAARTGEASPARVDKSSFYCESVTFMDASTNEYMNEYVECVPR